MPWETIFTESKQLSMSFSKHDEEVSLIFGALASIAIPCQTCHLPHWR